MENQKIRLTAASFNTINPVQGNPWSTDEIDKLELNTYKTYKETVSNCRFYYKHDPLASTAINKMVEIAINDLIFYKNGLSENEIKVFKAIKPELLDFSEAMAQEFLISGLVIPEITYQVVNKETIKNYGIKKYETLIMPTSMWLRDPLEVRINEFAGKQTYSVVVPNRMVFFILNKGKYEDGTTDRELYNKICVEYPEFVEAIRLGQREIVIHNDLIFRRKPITGNPYPVAYLESVLENLAHKRNLRRMDYSIASRVITAIQLFKLGSDDFPVTEDNMDVFDDLKQQIYWRDGTSKNIERIFQLFANHTLEIEWVYPPTEALLDDSKYTEVNRDIINGIGMPKILITGETERSASSQPEFAMASPIQTMEYIRKKILKVVNRICSEISKQNNFKTVPEAKFKPINLRAFAEFSKALRELYDTGNLSRTSYADYLGYDFVAEMDTKEADQKVLKDKKLDDFAAKPFSNQPDGSSNQEDSDDTKEEDTKNKPQNNVKTD